MCGSVRLTLAQGMQRIALEPMPLGRRGGPERKANSPTRGPVAPLPYLSMVLNPTAIEQPRHSIAHGHPFERSRSYLRVRWLLAKSGQRPGCWVSDRIAMVCGVADRSEPLSSRIAKEISADASVAGWNGTMRSLEPQVASGDRHRPSRRRGIPRSGCPGPDVLIEPHATIAGPSRTVSHQGLRHLAQLLP